MSFGGSKSTQTVTQEVPAYITDAHTANIETAKQLAERPWEAYAGDRIAPRSEDERNGIAMSKDAVGSWRPGLDAAQAAAQAAGTYAPQAVESRNVSHVTGSAALIDPASVGLVGSHAIDRSGISNVGSHGIDRAGISNVGSHAIDRSGISDVGAGALTDLDLSAYLNPHTQAVVDTTTADIERGGASADQALRARYAAGGAYGGSRQAVAQAENVRNTLDTVARTVAGLRQTGWDSATANATNDLNRRFAADQSNQAADLDVAGRNQSAAITADQSNQTADLTVAGRNQDAALTADRANQAADLDVAGRNQSAAITADQSNQARDLNIFGSTAATINDMTKANNQLDFDVKRTDADRALQAGLANQQAGLSGAALGLDASKVLAGLSQQTSQSAMNDAATIYGIGRDDRGDVQTALDQKYQDWISQRNNPIDMLGLQQNILGGVPYSTSSSQPVYSNTGTNTLTGAVAGAKLAGQLGIGNVWGAAAGSILGLLG